jgi:F-type H+-transporting ATPase subunit a
VITFAPLKSARKMQFVQNKVSMMRSFLMVALMILGNVAFAQHDAHAVAAHPAESVASHAEAAHAEEAHAEEKFNPGAMIMHHISDAHQIHFIGKLHMPLPVILWNHGHLDVFMSSNFWNGYDEKGELQFKPYTASSGTTYENHHESIVISAGEHGAVHGAHEKPMDFSITKSVFGMLFIIVLMIIIFRSVAARYKQGAHKAPTGLQNAIEPFILFVRDEVAIPSIGKKKAAAFMPFLLTVFFFIWMCNMLGLIPFLGGFNITGTLSITLVLATLVLLITSINGNAHYWGHIFWPPGIPFGIKLILVPIEALSIFIKPTVLMIRLTANITAGHIIILAFVGLVLLFGETSAVAGYGVGIGAVLFMIFMFFIELLVAFLQAYVFTLLAALYFGDATQEHHHEEDHH